MNDKTHEGETYEKKNSKGQNPLNTKLMRDKLMKKL